MAFTVAIVGRPNVGKSTLFNSLVGRKSAIVHDYPGVTRDRKEAWAKFLGLEFKLIDTAGYEMSGDVAMDVTKQIDFAISSADLLLLLLDAKTGIIAEDHIFIDYVRKRNKPVILVINKSESRNKVILSNDIYKFGFQDIVYLSAEHRIGYEDLFQYINSSYEEYLALYGAEEELSKNSNKIRIAVVGKPNVGKSTFINSLVGEERLLVANESGTTRDAIEISWQYKNHEITLIDTAGIRKRAKIHQKLEKLMYDDSIKAVRFSNICILLLDITQTKLEKQDLIIANHVINEGRGLVIALNKSDLLSQDELEEAMAEIEYQVSKYIVQNKAIKIYAISAKKNKSVEEVIGISTEIYDVWNIRLSTSDLNRWLNYAVNTHRPPLHKGKEVRFKYITQIKSRPPTFVIMTNYPDVVKDSYLKYLKNSLIENFNLSGVNPRMILKKISNPYNSRKGSKTIKR